MQKFVLVPVPFTAEMNQVIDSEYDRYGDHVSAQLAGMMGKVLAAAPQPPALGGDQVPRWLIQKTPIGTMMKPNAEGDWVELADHIAHVARLQAEVYRLENRIAAEQDRVMATIGQYAKFEARNAEPEGLLRDEQTRSKLTSLPLKLMFMKERNFQSIQEVHDWMLGVGNRIDAALAEGKEQDDTTPAEEEEDRRKVFVRSNTKQGQRISLAEMKARYEGKEHE